MDNQITFTVKIKMPYTSEQTAKFYLSSVLEDIKTKKDLINITEYEILESQND
jgi:hypothetical protein